tara:strand:+ start:148 stop:780 length:633 start_codon:yes stop_codon:yes gene_type:complete
MNFMSSNDQEATKMNIDELYLKKQERNLNTVKNYNKILNRIHTKIRYTAKNTPDNHCWYVIPEILIGIPVYNSLDCTCYILNKLKENGFIINYTFPNLLFICWNHWVPTYVRNEFKKKTGKIVNEKGEILNNNDLNNDNIFNTNHNNSNNNNNNNITNIFDNTKKNNENENNNNESKDNKQSENQYKNINSYKPSGSIIYNNSLLEKLVI